MAASALGSTGSEQAVKPLAKALATDEDSDVRDGAADALGRLGSEQVIEPLVKAITTDKNSSVRGRAASALGIVGSEQAIKPLKQALADEGQYAEEIVKDVAFAALEKISRRALVRITAPQQRD